MTSETVQAAQRLLEELTEAARSAFITSESCGATAEYRHIFRFRTLAELQAFGRAWVAVTSSQPAPAAAPEDAERRFGPITSDQRDAERNIRAKEDAERAAYLARWKDAPADATHLAQDSDGVCWFYESEPILDSDQNWFGACALRDVADNLLGSVKCEPRPVQGVEG